MKYPTIKLSQLIDELETIKKKNGDLPVVLSKTSCTYDNEENTFGTISEEFEDDSYFIEGDVLVIKPYAENKELEDIEGYNYDAVEDDDDDTDYEYDYDNIEPIEFDCA